jgi:hypothetical protein
MSRAHPRRLRPVAAAVGELNRRFGGWISLGIGAGTAILWRAGIDQIRAAIVLASLATVVVLLLVAPPWESARPQAVAARPWLSSAAWWATVVLARNALWFVIPFYVLSTTWPSRNAPFTLLLVVLGVLACFHVFLRERVLRGGGVAVAFVAPALLAALQLFLPMLSGVSPRVTSFASGAIASVLAGCLAAPDRFLRRLPAWRAPVAIAFAAALGAVAGRAALPLLAPAPLRVASARFALGRDGLDPVAPVPALVADATRSAFVFVSVEAPRGLRETVRLVVDGDGGGARETRTLEISGGRPGGYRLWAPLRAHDPGRIRATVRTEGGQIVGAASIDVVAPASLSASPRGVSR